MATPTAAIKITIDNESAKQAVAEINQLLTELLARIELAREALQELAAATTDQLGEQP